MFERMIREAFHSGCEAKVYIRGVPDTYFHGRVQDVEDGYFSLFHSGASRGMLWAFRFEDVAACALETRLPAAVPLPDPLADSVSAPDPS
ncbi:hypothetical protein J7643_00175 [bacterium]|nr:hypothetical protein [bacterium]